MLERKHQPGSTGEADTHKQETGFSKRRLHSKRNWACRVARSARAFAVMSNRCFAPDVAKARERSHQS